MRVKKREGRSEGIGRERARRGLRGKRRERKGTKKMRSLIFYTLQIQT